MSRVIGHVEVFPDFNRFIRACVDTKTDVPGYTILIFSFRLHLALHANTCSPNPNLQVDAMVSIECRFASLFCFFHNPANVKAEIEGERSHP